MIGFILVWLTMYLSGTLLCKAAGDKKASLPWVHLTGFFFLVLSQGIIFTLGQLLGLHFGQAAAALAVFLIIVSLTAILVCRREWKRDRRRMAALGKKDFPYRRHLALLLWLFLALSFAVINTIQENRNDAITEIVHTTLATDSMNEYHPFTGQKLELGVIFSRKLLTLPFWYSALSQWTGLEPVVTVRGLGSLLTLALSLAAFSELAGLLFFRNFKKTWLFAVLLELLWLSGDYCLEATGYQQLFYGYSGEVITGTVLLPYLMCVLYRFYGSFIGKGRFGEKRRITLRGFLLFLAVSLPCCLFLANLSQGAAVAAAAMVLFVLSIAGSVLNKSFHEKWGKGNE